MRNVILPLLVAFSCFLSSSISAQCDCENLEFDPVCAINEQGDLIEFLNACEAECQGFEVIDAELCGLVVTDPLEGDCEEVACAMDQEGNIFEMPICLIDVFGFELVEGEDCSYNEEEGEEENPDDCETLVCVVDFGGVVSVFPLCIAEELGLEIIGDEGDCVEIIDEEEEEEIEGDCETLVCASDIEGNVCVLPLCIAESLGYEIIGDDGDCEGIIIDEEEEIEGDCETIVCAIDQEGNIFEMPLCLIDLLGFEIADTDDCTYVYEEEEEEGDCETLVCVIDFDGVISVFPLCFAEELGLEIIGDEGDCVEIIDEEEEEEEIEGDCETIVCAIDQEGNIFEMPLCLIDLLGFELADTDDCTYVYEEEEEEEEGDCETLVCVIDFDGVISVFPLCFAEELGLEIIGDEGDCVEIIDEEEEEVEGDCETIVCAIDQEGNIFEMPLCLIDLLGFEIADTDDCTYVYEEEEEEEEGDCETLVCVIDFDGVISVFPLCFAEELGLEIIGDEGDCVEIIDEEEEEEEIEGDCETIVCAIDQEGNIFEMPLCLIEILGFEIADTDDCTYVYEEEEEEEEGDCETLVCAIDFGGVVSVYPICIAEELGLEIIGDEGDCVEIIDEEEEENPLGEDCEEIVCVIDQDGNIFTFPACLAEEFGFDIADATDCDLIDEEFEGDGNDDDQITVDDLEDLGDWVFDITGEFIDRDGEFFIETAFPNPTENMINISVSSEYVNKVNYIVRGLDGRIIIDEQVVLAEGASKLQLNLNDQPGGIYMVQLIDDNGYQATTRVVKMN